MASQVAPQSFAGHVHELRRRITWTVLALMAGAAVAFVYRQKVVSFIVKPLGLPLFYSTPSGSFEFVMRVSLSVGAIVALPILVYNLIRFIEPALQTRRANRKTALIIIVSSTFLAVMGLAFAFMLVLPMAFHFFSEFNIGPIKPLISTSDYLGFVLGCLVTFALIFQLPLVLLTFNNIRRFPPGSLRKFRRHVIVGSLAIALVLPFTYDPITQFIVALPVIVLFETSVLAIWLTNRKHHKSARRTRTAPSPSAPAPPVPAPQVSAQPPVMTHDVPHQPQTAQSNARPVVRRPVEAPKRRLIQL